MTSQLMRLDHPAPLSQSVAFALRHPNRLGAGARLRRKLSAKDKIRAVMEEFRRGTLHAGSGAIVQNRKQAIAIAFSEARKRA